MKRKYKFFIVIAIFIAIISEGFYFQHTYSDSSSNRSGCDVVLVYGGYLTRTRAGVELANKEKIPIFISDIFGGPEDVQRRFGPVNVPITVDHYARTTDQNARNAVKFLKAGNYHHAVLVTNWYHQPRSLFLTRLYLLRAKRGFTTEAQRHREKRRWFRVKANSRIEGFITKIRYRNNS